MWTNTEVRAPTVVPKLSTKTGLIYAYTRPPDPAAQGYYWTAIDWRNGQTAWSRYAGLGPGVQQQLRRARARSRRHRLPGRDRRDHRAARRKLGETDGKRGSIGLGVCAVAVAATFAGTANAGLTGESTYAAMAFEKNSGALGTVWLQASLPEAKANAIKECKKIADRPNRCRVQVTEKDGCVAAATNRDIENVKYGFGEGKTPRKAKKAAKKELPDGDGRIVQTVCSDSGPV